MEKTNELINKRVNVYYNDTFDKVSKLVGTISSINDMFIVLEINNLLKWIQLNKIVRIEELEVGQ